MKGPRTAILLFLLGGACYLNTLRNGFVWDDHQTVVENAFIHDLGNARRILRPSFLWKPQWDIENQARPVWILSAMLDWTLWKDRAFGHHLTNVLLHAANGALFYLLLAAAGAPGQTALWAAALFAAHPVHAEAVAPVSFREDLLAAFFCLLSLLAFLRGRRSSGAKTALWALASLAAFFLAVMSKQMAATLPALLLLFELVILPRGGKALAPRRLAIYAPFLLVLGFYLWFNSVRFNYRPILDISASVSRSPAAAQAGKAPASAVSPVYSSPLTNARTMSVVFSDYLLQLLFPLRLCADYTVAVPRGLDAASLKAALILGASLALAGWGCLRLPWLGFGILWFFVSLAPVSNLVPILNLRADRYLYLPSLGFCVAAAALLDEALARWRRPAISAAALALVLCAFRTAARNRVWHDDATLWEDTSRCSPGNQRARYNAGLYLQQSGRFEEAVREYEAALALSGGRNVIRLNLGACYEALSRPAEAQRAYREGLASEPSSTPFLNNLASLYLRGGRCEEAVPLYRKLLAAQPEEYVARNNLGICYAQLGDPARAANELKAVVKSHPEYQPARENLRRVESMRK